METDQPFGEGGSGDVLPCLFVVFLRFEHWGFSAGYEVGWVVSIEERLARGVCVRTKFGITVVGVVFAVVEDDDSGGG